MSRAPYSVRIGLATSVGVDYNIIYGPLAWLFCVFYLCGFYVYFAVQFVHFVFYSVGQKWFHSAQSKYSQKSATRLRDFVRTRKVFSSIAYARWGGIVFSADVCAHQTEALPANHSLIHFLAWNKRIGQHTKQNQQAVIVRKKSEKGTKNPNTALWPSEKQRQQQHQHYAKNGTIITYITK